MIKTIAKEHHPKKQAKRFKYAFDGIFHALVNEANFRVQLFYAVLVVMAGFYFRINPAEWGLLILSLGLLLAAEMINTVVENVIDALIKEYDEAAKVIKDLSAGFVLVIGITTIIVSAIIFIPYFIIYST
jgi:diacylglycerol kinase